MLEFESELKDIEHELSSLRRNSNGDMAKENRASHLQAELAHGLQNLYAQLTPWQKVQVARHRERPYTLDYLQLAFSDFVELHGDRAYGDDHAIVGGPALLDAQSVMVVGHQKGRDTRESVARNFGMPHPEGYRKAERLMLQADRMGMPVVTLVDTPGAHAGLEDEERGQSEAIASCISTMLALNVPTVCVVIGEGGSGGALALASADRILMLEHSTLTVASPEAAAAILWRDSGKASDAAANMRITAQELIHMNIVDGIISEPIGGAHRDHGAAAAAVSAAISSALAELQSVSLDELRENRYSKFRNIGFYGE